jgi:hypothetical protein
VHEIERIDGKKVFPNGRKVFEIGGNKFYNQNKGIPIKIRGGGRCRIGMIIEFRRIQKEFPNQGL